MCFFWGGGREGGIREEGYVFTRPREEERGVFTGLRRKWRVLESVAEKRDVTEAVNSRRAAGGGVCSCKNGRVCSPADKDRAGSHHRMIQSEINYEVQELFSPTIR